MKNPHKKHTKVKKSKYRNRNKRICIRRWTKRMPYLWSRFKTNRKRSCKTGNRICFSKLKLVNYVRNIYKCEKCGTEESELLHSDETTMQCNKEQGRKASSNSYMWVIASGKLEIGVIFNYSKSRSSEVAPKLLKGYKGILVTDQIFWI